MHFDASQLTDLVFSFNYLCLQLVIKIKPPSNQFIFFSFSGTVDVLAQRTHLSKNISFISYSASDQVKCNEQGKRVYLCNETVHHALQCETELVNETNQCSYDASVCVCIPHSDHTAKQWRG